MTKDELIDFFKSTLYNNKMHVRLFDTTSHYLDYNEYISLLEFKFPHVICVPNGIDTLFNKLSFSIVLKYSFYYVSFLDDDICCVKNDTFSTDKKFKDILETVKPMTLDEHMRFMEYKLYQNI